MRMTKLEPLRAAVMALALGLAGCSFAPSYHAPELPVAPAWKGTAFWRPAAPADASTRGDWWQAFGDPRLDALEADLDRSNPTLAEAVARFDMARAQAGEAESARSPHVDLGASPASNRQSDHKPLRGATQPADYASDTVQFSFGYELDFWGRVRNQVAAGRARADAAEGDLASARLGLQAELADLYFRAAGDDAQAQILARSIAAYREALGLTERRFAGGVDSALAVARARTQLSDALAQAEDVTAQRALVGHAIATLTGRSASSFSLPPQTVAMTLPALPAGIPSTLLQRRPDIAAAERRVFAANADIGVARAASYPSFSLSAVFGWQNAGGGGLLGAGNRMWSVGPVASLGLLDGGLRRSREAGALAAHDAAAAHYRATVLSAFQQVEDQLSLLTDLGREAGHEADAAASARQAADIATHRYQDGAVAYLDVVVAQTAWLQAMRADEALRTRRLQAGVALVRALGGGWHAP